MLKITLKKNGNDYQVYVNGRETTYEIVKHYDIWTIYKGDNDLHRYNDTLKQAKEEITKLISWYGIVWGE